MKFELWGKNDGFLLLGVLALFVISGLWVASIMQRAAEDANKPAVELTIRRPAQQAHTHQPRRVRRERSADGQ
jgi:hypothetical protein